MVVNKTIQHLNKKSLKVKPHSRDMLSFVVQNGLAASAKIILSRMTLEIRQHSLCPVFFIFFVKAEQQLKFLL